MMTRRDQAMLLGCLTIALVAMMSLSAAPIHRSAAVANTASMDQPLQLSRVHSLTSVSLRAVSVF